LDKIYQTPIGKLLLDSFTSSRKTYITVLEGKEKEECPCFADTVPTLVGDDVRVEFPEPRKFRDDEKVWQYRFGSDDILLHEMVHAYRLAQGFYDFIHRRYYYDRGELINTEEFIATVLQNIYRATRGSLQFYRYSSSGLSVAPKEDTYKYLSSEVELLQTLKLFLMYDPLAVKVARLTAPDFNPFRDYPGLEREFYRRDPFLNMKRMLPLPF
jgi:hypothetical protein